MTEASSRPTRPKQITPKEFSTKRGLAGILKSAAVMVVPKRDQIRMPRPIRTAAAMKVPIAPRLLIHLPTPRPTMLRTVSSARSASEVMSGESFVIGESGVAGAEREHRDADEVEHDGRHVEHVVGPVAPAGEESVEVAEDFFGPEIDAAFAGITVGEFDDGDALRPEEKDEGDDPEPDGDAAVGGDGRDDVEVEDGDDEEEDEIAASEGADEVGRGGLGGGGQVALLASEKQVPHRASPGSE